MTKRCPECHRWTDAGRRCLACQAVPRSIDNRADSDPSYSHQLAGHQGEPDDAWGEMIYLPPWRNREPDGSLSKGSYGPRTLHAFREQVARFRESKAGGGLWS